MVDNNTPTADIPQRVSPLATIERAGVNEDAATLILQPLENMAVVQVFARKGHEAGVAAILGDVPGQSRSSAAYTSMPIAPAQWIVTATTGGDGEFRKKLQQELGDNVYLSEQSHARIIIRVAGSGARELLQKGCRLDLHPMRTSAGFCAQTSMAQVGVLIHQLDESPTYDLHLYSGFARSFWHWLTESAAVQGFKVAA